MTDGDLPEPCGRVYRSHLSGRRWRVAWTAGPRDDRHARLEAVKHNGRPFDISVQNLRELYDDQTGVAQ